MSDQNQETETENQGPSEIEMLRSRAKLMNIPFSGNTGIETLRAKIAEKMGEAPAPAVQTEEPIVAMAPAPEAPVNPLVDAPAPQLKARKLSLRKYLQQEEMKLLRVRITCLDPKKKDLPGEIITVANEHLGTVRKFIPYGEVTDEGYHIEKCLYTVLNERKFLNIRTSKDRQNQNKLVTTTNYVREFSIEILPPLTEEELSDLARAQLAAGSLDSNAA